jgi:hypothetical protein
MGVALAATITLVVSDRPYGLFTTVVGVSLLGVLVGYYRPSWKTVRDFPHALRRALALGAVGGLCIGVTTAFPVQQLEGVGRVCILQLEAYEDQLALARARNEPVPAVSDAFYQEIEDCLFQHTTTIWVTGTWLASAILIATVFLFL